MKEDEIFDDKEELEEILKELQQNFINVIKAKSEIWSLIESLARQEVEAEIEKRIPNEEEIENGINTLAQLHALKSVGDWATGYITGAKWFRNRMKGNNK